MKVFCVKTAAVVAGVSEQINARSRAPFALIPAATAAVLNPLTTIVLLSITLCVARTARRRREGTLARGERRDGGHAVPSLTPGTRYLLYIGTPAGVPGDVGISRRWLRSLRSLTTG